MDRHPGDGRRRDVDLGQPGHLAPADGRQGALTRLLDSLGVGPADATGAVEEQAAPVEPGSAAGRPRSSGVGAGTGRRRCASTSAAAVSGGGSEDWPAVCCSLRAGRACGPPAPSDRDEPWTATTPRTGWSRCLAEWAVIAVTATCPLRLLGGVTNRDEEAHPWTSGSSSSPWPWRTWTRSVDFYGNRVGWPVDFDRTDHSRAAVRPGHAAGIGLLVPLRRRPRDDAGRVGRSSSRWWSRTPTPHWPISVSARWSARASTTSLGVGLCTSRPRRQPLGAPAARSEPPRLHAEPALQVGVGDGPSRKPRVPDSSSSRPARSRQAERGSGQAAAQADPLHARARRAWARG